jgi:hypothetical protein
VVERSREKMEREGEEENENGKRKNTRILGEDK